MLSENEKRVREFMDRGEPIPDWALDALTFSERLSIQHTMKMRERYSGRRE